MGSCDNLDKPDLSNTVIFEYSKEGWKSSAIRYRSFLTCEDRGTAEDTTPALAMDFEIYYSAQGNDHDGYDVDIKISLVGMEDLTNERLPAIRGIDVPSGRIGSGG